MPNNIELGEHNIRYIASDDKGNIWIASKDGYLAIKDVNGEIHYIDRKGKTTRNKTSFGANVYSIYFDRDNNVWLGTKDKGLFILTGNESNYRIISNIHSNENKYSLSDNNIYSI